ncbi:MAG: hypothetical protein J6I85_02380 [Clostridia bacterium]|nr:hypothetical protein [Clostridia bacterium]
MVILKRKQITIATLCACLSIFTFMFTAGHQEKTEETVVLPVSRKENNFRCWPWDSR